MVLSSPTLEIFNNNKRKGKMNNKKGYHKENSKTTKILKHLLCGGTINNVKAFTDFNTTRLSSVIKSLRDMGYFIETYYKPNSILANYKSAYGYRTSNKVLFKGKCK